MDGHCAHCPVSAELGVCPAIARPHPPFCNLVDPDHRDHRPQYAVEILRLAGLASPWSAPPVAAPGIPPSPAARVLIRAVAPAQTGYGLVIEQLGRGLEQLGVPVAFELFATAEGFPAPVDFIQSRAITGRAQDAWTLQVGIPNGSFDHSRATVAFTMWETDRLPREAVQKLNQCQAIVVPCEWNRDAFKASGVRRPITVVPLGVDCDRPRRGPRVPGQPFRFGMAGRIRNGENRKGLNEGMAAFTKAFPASADVELVVKCGEACLAALDVPDDPRITILSVPLSDAEIRDWYAGLDAFLCPSKAEGWGLQPLEAMAAGVPVIAARYGGLAEYFDGACGWELEWDLGEASATHYSHIGSWAVPREESLVAALRAAYANPAECQAKGEAAAERARSFSWDRSAAALREVLVAAGMLADPDRPASGGTWDVAAGPVPNLHRVEAPRRNIYQERLALVYECDYRGPQAGCGCNATHVCWRGKTRDGRASLAECLQCVAGDLPPVTSR